MPARFLVCPPAQFSVAYEAPGALRQWDRFIETLGCAGDVTFVTMEPHESVPDLVFTANAALISGNLAIVSSFRHPNRRGEQGLYRAALTKAGLATTYLQQTYFEGSATRGWIGWGGWVARAAAGAPREARSCSCKRSSAAAWYR